MSDPAIAALIREVLAEELARIAREKAPSGAATSAVREEHVTISSDADLQAFARQVLKHAADPKARTDIEQGRLVFRLAGGTAQAPRHAEPASPGNETAIESGIISERQVDRLPKDTKKLRITKHVRLTPLARDRLRHRGISIERME